MEKADVIISKASLQSKDIACEAWLLPEVAGTHLVQGKDSRSVKKNVALAAKSAEDLPVEQNDADLRDANVNKNSSANAEMVPESLGDFNEAMTLGKLRRHAESIQADAYQTGFVSGQTEGLAAGEKQVAEQVELLNQLVKSVREDIEKDREALKATIELIIKRIAEAFCAREVSDDESLIARSVQDALESLVPSNGKPTVFLSETDLKLLKSKGLLDDDIEWDADPALASGGCRVKAAHGEVDNSFEQRLGLIIDQLFDVRR